jgi:cytochrome c-type biogenesis protein CcmH
MTLLVLALFTLAALSPLLLVLRGGGSARSRRDSALAIHRAQLVELDRDLAEGRIAAPEHANAVLEVQRRLLAAGASPDTAPPARAARAPLLAVALLVPVAAAGLYTIAGHPFLPAAPLARRIADADRAAENTDALIAHLRDKLAAMDQTSEIARQGYVLLGNAEDSRGRLPEAAAAWRKAVAIRFDARLAALAAEAQTRLDGKVSADSAALFRRALVEGPADAAWRKIAEQRLAQAEGS